LVDIPTRGKGGFIWNRLHGEREDIRAALLKADEPSANERRELLQSRLRKLDDALDRLMSGSYGHCSSCGRPIEDKKLDMDPAWALCRKCSGSELEMSSGYDVWVEDLKAFDTLVVQTHNSAYRMLLLDPQNGRALVEGGSFFTEPTEALIVGSAVPGSKLNGGAVCIGGRLEMWVDERVFLTSPVKSVHVKAGAAAVSVEDISATLH